MRDLARLGAAALALLVVLRDLAVAGPSQAMVAATAIVVVAVAAALTLWRDGFVTGSGVVLAAHYVLSLGLGRVEADLAAPLVGGLILLYLELADLAAALPRDRQVDRALLRATLRRAGGVLVLATTAGTAAFVLAAVPWPAGEVVRAAGALGVAAAVAVPVILLRRL